MTSTPPGRSTWREIERKGFEVGGAGLVHHVHPTHVGGHVGHHKVDTPAAQLREQRIERRLLAEVALLEDDAGNRVHRQQVKCIHGAIAGEPPRCVLAPPAWRRAEVDDHGAREKSFSAASISSSLNAARERNPASLARCTNGSEKCSSSQRPLDLLRRAIRSSGTRTL